MKSTTVKSAKVTPLPNPDEAHNIGVEVAKLNAEAASILFAIADREQQIRQLQDSLAKVRENYKKIKPSHDEALSVLNG